LDRRYWKSDRRYTINEFARQITTKKGQHTSPISPEKRRGRPEKVFKIDDMPENVARALWGERLTRFPENQVNQTPIGA
jgi:hypothetical protein